MKHLKLYLLWIAAFVYVFVKYGLLDTQSKFDGGLVAIAITAVYSLPFFLFLLSSYLLLKRTKRFWLQAVICVAFTLIACRIVYFLYSDLNAVLPPISSYFDELNTGYFVQKAEDFRLEYFIVFVLNLIAFFIFIDRKIQPYINRNNEDKN